MKLPSSLASLPALRSVFALGLAAGDPEINNNYGWFLCQNGREQLAINYFMAAAKNPLYATPTGYAATHCTGDAYTTLM